MRLKYRPIPTFTESEIAAFWSLVDKRGPKECWPWIGRRHTRGYGFFDANKNYRSLRSTRVLIKIVTGSDPGNNEACHSCDYPPCCNPDHVFAGTHTDNMADMSAKGRANVRRGKDHHFYGRPDLMPAHSGWHPAIDLAGEKHPRSKLTADDVRKIREMGDQGTVIHAEMARMFKVSHKLIVNVLLRRTWEHI
jgi:hypothetical protein